MIIEIQEDKTLFNSKFLTRIYLRKDSYYYDDDTNNESSEEDFYEITAILHGSSYEYTLARYTSEEQAVDAYNALAFALIGNESYFKMPK